MTTVSACRAGARFVVWLSAVLPLAGCATVTGGARDQEVRVDSSPPGAAVRVDGEQRGVTPLIVPLQRDRAHEVQLEMPGYAPWQATLQPGVNPWLWGDLAWGAGGLLDPLLFLGAPAGLAVDLCTGAGRSLHPASVTAEFPPAPPTAVPAAVPSPAAALPAPPRQQAETTPPPSLRGKILDRVLDRGIDVLLDHL